MSSAYKPTAAITQSWFLTGPTAGGKSAISLELAERNGGEIISMDSMAVYRGLDIGTAKPTLNERERIPHHLIDVVDPDADFSIATFLELASQAAEDIRARGKTPLFVGGTPLYLKALLHGLDSGPPPNAEMRAELEARFDADPEGLYAELLQVDPDSADRVHPNDKKRVVRAIEYYRLAGQPMSQVQTHFDAAVAPERLFVLSWPRDILHKRIEARVDAMMTAGLLEEARQVQQRWPSLSRTAAQAVGYEEMFAVLAGECSLETGVEKIKTRTRRFARRQETWFRSLQGAKVIAMQQPVDPAQLARDITSQSSPSA